MTKHLVVIDGYGFVFRAFHSMPPLTRKDGVVVGAVFGFCSMIMRLLTEIHATHICIVFDSGKQNFRHRLYEAYKANREEAPEELKAQFPIIRQAAKAFNIVSIEKEGFEADDIIATLANRGKENDYKVTIVSSDKDLMQLVNKGVMMFDPMKWKIIDREYVFEKFGVYPERVRDYLSLLGDTSDNIPGVKGIGAKGASELINQFGSLADILDNADKISQNRYRNAILANTDNAKLSYELVGLDCEVSLENTFDDLEIKEINKEELIGFFEKNQFRQLQRKIDPTIDSIKKSDSSNSIISTKHFDNAMSFQKLELSDLKKHINNTISILNIDDKLVISAENGCYSHLQDISEISNILENPSIVKLFFGAKKFFKINNIINHYEDLQLMAYVIDSSKNFENISNVYTHFLESETIEVGKQAYYMFMLYNLLRQKLIENQVFKVYADLEKPLIPILANMENNGILLDENIILNLKSEFSENLKVIENAIYNECGVSFNVGSPKQLGEILFEKLNLPGGKKGKSGSYSTDNQVLEDLSINGHTIADKIIEWRMYSKLISTYTDSLIQSKADDGRIHSTFSQITTITGRLSSSSPNLQNIPIKTPEGHKIRGAFVASEGFKLLSFDYSQIELRILAHMANVPELINAFNNNQDIHKATAASVFGVSLENVDDSLRRKAKAVNFGIIYGISAFGLAKQLGTSRNEAKDIIDKYLATYSGIKSFMEKSQEDARKQGYATTLLGRKCYINDILSSNFTVRGFAERLAINAPIQGTAADIIKKAMIDIKHFLSDDLRLVLQVHDELIFEIREGLDQNIINKLTNSMQSTIKLNVPLTVDYAIGKSWSSI